MPTLLFRSLARSIADRDRVQSGPMNNPDVIVIGLGGVGSSTLYHLARRGVTALGIERFTLAHDRGSSHGGTRLIRRAYFEHPDYIPLVDRSFEGWDEIEKKSGARLFHRTGLLLFGPSDGAVISGTRRAARAHGLDIRAFGPETAAARFPDFRTPAGAAALFEPAAGTLAVEACIRTYVETAQRLGATARFGERVLRWSASDDGVTVETDVARYGARSLIITAGPWANEVLADLNLPLTLRRKPVFWFETGDARLHRDSGCPVFGFEIDRHFLYGFPSTDGETVKIGDHTDGDVISSADAVERGMQPGDLDRLVPFVESCLPGVGQKVVKHTVCLYTITPDEHFIIDRHPRHPNVAFAAGLSGHGFKFAPVLGSALVDLALSGRTEEPVGFLGLDRPGLRATES